jgi:ethanolamine ammonia-lyase small subunit
MSSGIALTASEIEALGIILEQAGLADQFDDLQRANTQLAGDASILANAILTINEATGVTSTGVAQLTDDMQNFNDVSYEFGSNMEELFFGGKYGNVTGSLYRTVVQQGVGTLYNKQEVIVSNVFQGFFNEREAAARISAIVQQVLAEQVTG